VEKRGKGGDASEGGANIHYRQECVSATSILRENYDTLCGG